MTRTTSIISNSFLLDIPSLSYKTSIAICNDQSPFLWSKLGSKSDDWHPAILGSSKFSFRVWRFFSYLFSSSEKYCLRYLQKTHSHGYRWNFALKLHQTVLKSDQNYHIFTKKSLSFSLFSQQSINYDHALLLSIKEDHWFACWPALLARNLLASTLHSNNAMRTQ